MSSYWDRVAVLGQGGGLYPRMDALSGTVNTVSVSTGESAEQDTGITEGCGVLFIWLNGGSVFLRMAQYGVAGSSVAGGTLPDVTVWPYLRVSGSNERFFAVNVDVQRRYFRFRTDVARDVYWLFENA